MFRRTIIQEKLHKIIIIKIVAACNIIHWTIRVKLYTYMYSLVIFAADGNVLLRFVL